MSVAKGKRGLADTEFFHNGLHMRDVIMDLMIRDFGVKVRKKDLNRLKEKYDMADEDLETLKNIYKEYKIYEDVTYDEFPSWFMDYERKFLFESIHRFLINLRYADAITVNSESTHERRKYHIVQARTECFIILEEFEYIARVFSINMNKYLNMMDVICYEIKLLNRLEKNDGDRWKRWKKNKDQKKDPQHTPTQEISEPGKTEQPKHVPNPFDNDLTKTPFDDIKQKAPADPFITPMKTTPVKMVRKEEVA
jgi:hypothetical protein